MNPPGYFATIQANAARRWEQLEGDPEIAGPWHILFEQVQRPRHVLSELLQNADDAQATEATVDIRNGEFIFSHNGFDFSEANFSAICKFGYSNKRVLHTIGFRGIGFKSTFSIGDEIRLTTPSLSVVFRRARFTLPEWLDRDDVQDRTEIRVPIRDSNCLLDLETNLEEWQANPLSLLFLNNLRCLYVQGRRLQWKNVEPGPIEGSTWMELMDTSFDRYLLLRSKPLDLPREALPEIRRDRMQPDGAEYALPPCTLEIVVGAAGTLFSVLPTSVKTSLPFACNAPFLQEPDREKIKEPSTSATNRWLLKCIGDMAANCMLAWLQNVDLEPDGRAEAYGLLPETSLTGNPLDDACTSIIRDAFNEIIRDKYCLLSDSAELWPAQGCVALPAEILNVWPTDEASILFDSRKRQVLSRFVGDSHRKKLVGWQLVDEIGQGQIVQALVKVQPPKPKSWQQLLLLWAYVSDLIVSHRHYDPYNYKQARIVPVQGSDVLHSADKTVRLGDKKLLQDESDWGFLSSYLRVLNPNWQRYLLEQRNLAQEDGHQLLGGQVNAAYNLLHFLGLSEAHDVSNVLQQVADEFFRDGQPSLHDCVRLTQITASLGGSVNDNCRYYTQANQLKKAHHQIVMDIDGRGESLIDVAWAKEHLLHDAYSTDFGSCTKDDWRQWSLSSRSKLLSFVPLKLGPQWFYSYHSLSTELSRRAYKGECTSIYRSTEYYLEDWDFEEIHWRYWSHCASSNSLFWGQLLSWIIQQPRSYWETAITARAFQVAKNGNRRQCSNEPILPVWIARFRELACLPDTHGVLHKPADLLLRTQETEALLGIEPFVDRGLDTEGNRQLLLKLGVRDKPTGPTALLGRLRALAKSDMPPVHEVEKWYRQLDQLIPSISLSDLQDVRQAFVNERLILSENNRWANSKEVFLRPDEHEFPGLDFVRASIRDLPLWGKVDIQDRPTIERILDWLKSLPSNKPLEVDELRRVRAVLARHPERIWNECGHWLSLSGEWVAVGDLKYALSMQSLFPWSNLFPWVKSKTANFQNLSAEVVQAQPFAALPSLASQIEDRFNGVHQAGPEVTTPWLARIGAEMQRIEFDDEDETVRIRSLAARLAVTKLHKATDLETVPYINGTPAGTARTVDVLWKDEVLFVSDRSAASLAKSVAQELGRVFNRQEISDALKTCVYRDPDFISDYFSTNFKLADVDTTSKTKSILESRDGKSPKTDVDIDKPAPPIEPRTDPNEKLQLDRWRLVNRPPVKPSVIERFARGQGFAWDTDKYVHPDGSVIVRTATNSFPWEHRAASGDAIRYYYPREHCLELGALQLDAAIWNLCDKFPNLYSLILTRPDDTPIEIRGRQLRDLVDKKHLELFPATYRLVFTGDSS